MNQERTVSGDRGAVEVSLLVMRVVVGGIFAAHGSQKLLGAFGWRGRERPQGAKPRTQTHRGCLSLPSRPPSRIVQEGSL